MAIASNSLQTEELLSAPADLPTPLSALLLEPVLANPDPLAGLVLADPIAAHPSMTSMDGLDVALAHYSSQLAGSGAHTLLPDTSSDLLLSSTDQLTGLVLSDSPDSPSLLDANLSPLLATSFASDGFLVYGGSETQSFSLAEDQPFSVDLAALFPQANGLQSVSVTPLLAGDSADWLQFEQRLPDATLAERLVIEGLFYDSQGNLLNPEAVASLAAGSLVQLDLVVTDTRFDGQGLIGLDLDLLWNPQALSLDQVQIAPSLPLFQSSGILDAAAGSLRGLVGASLPSSGTGEVLGDAWREVFASLDFRVGPDALAGFNLGLNPTKLPARANQPLDRLQVVAVDSTTATLPLLSGLAGQALVGTHSYQLQALDADGRPWQQTLSLTIANVNDAPVAVPFGPITAVEDQPFAFGLADVFRDEDLAVGDVLTYRLRGASPGWLQLNGTSGLLQGTPGNAEVGSYQLEVEARDLSGATARQILELVVGNVNDAPVWSGESLPEIWVREGNPFEIRLPSGTIIDLDQGDRIRYSLDLTRAPGLASLLAIDPATGVVTGLAPADQGEPYAFGIVATDRAGASTTVPLQLRVVDREFNRAPYRVGFDLFDRTIQEGQRLAFDLPSLFRDDDVLIGDRLDYEVDVPDWLQFDPRTGQVSGLADNDAVGSHRVTLRAVDSWGASTVASFWLTVANVNQAPDRLVPANEQRSLLVNSPFALNLNTVFRDLDAIHGDRLRFSLKARSSATLGLPSGLRFDPVKGELSFTPGASDRGQLSLLFSATDRLGASSTYQLDLGIVSPGGLVEVNRALQDLVLREGTPSTLDLSSAFEQLRSSSNLAYSVEAFRLGKDGKLNAIQDPSWLSLFDRRQDDNSSNDRLTVAPVLRRLDTGALVRPEDLAALPADTALALAITVNDRRQATAIPGVIGLDLDLNWSGLQLINQDPSALDRAMTSLFPLFRQIDSSDVGDNQLRFSAGSLPRFGLGEALGDSPEEAFLNLQFLLNDPSKPVRVDLKLNGEDQGGLGLGLADGSSPGPNVQLKPFSSSALIDLLLRPGAAEVGNLVLRITAKSGDQDAISQLLRVRVDSKNSGNDDSDNQRGYVFLDYENFAVKSPPVVDDRRGSPVKDARTPVLSSETRVLLPPLIIGLLDRVKAYERGSTSVLLSDLFSNPNSREDGRSALNYQIRVTSSSVDNQARLAQSLVLDSSVPGTRLVFDPRGLVDLLAGQVQLIATIGGLESSQVFAIELIPRAEVVNIFASANQAYITEGQPVPLGKIFGAPPLVFNDSSDVTDLNIRSTQPITVHLSQAFKTLAGLTDAQAASLEAQWRTLPANAAIPGSNQGVVVPISELINLVGPDQAGFDLDWIDVVPVATSSGFLSIEISTSTRVRGDDGSRFGIQESSLFQSTLVVPRQQPIVDIPPDAGFQPSPIGNVGGDTSPLAKVGSLEGGYGSGPIDRLETPAKAGVNPVGGGAGGAGGAELGGADLPKAKSLLSTSDPDAEALSSDSDLPGQRRRQPGNPDDPNDLKGLLDNLIEAFNNPGSLAGLLLAMITMPSGGERGLRSLLLDSRLGQAIQLQRRNPELESEWHLQLRRPDGQTLSLLLQLRGGQLTLLEAPKGEAEPIGEASITHGNPPVAVVSIDREAFLLKALDVISYPGELLADISRKLDCVLTSGEVDVDWNGWLSNLAQQCGGPGASAIRAGLGQLQQAVTLALSVDQSMADAVMVSQLLQCQVQLGGELPWLKA